MVGNIASEFYGVPHISGMPTLVPQQNDRFSVVEGGYVVRGNKCYVNVVLKLIASISFGDHWESADWYWNTRCQLAEPYGARIAPLNAICFKKRSNGNLEPPVRAEAHVEGYNNGILYVAANQNLDGTTDDIYFLIYGSYDV